MYTLFGYKNVDEHPYPGVEESVEARQQYKAPRSR
jgi:hypothetical protein